MSTKLSDSRKINSTLPLYLSEQQRKLHQVGILSDQVVAKLYFEWNKWKSNSSSIQNTQVQNLTNHSKQLKQLQTDKTTGNSIHPALPQTYDWIYYSTYDGYPFVTHINSKNPQLGEELTNFVKPVISSIDQLNAKSIYDITNQFHYFNPRFKRSYISQYDISAIKHNDKIYQEEVESLSKGVSQFLSSNSIWKTAFVFNENNHWTAIFIVKDITKQKLIFYSYDPMGPSDISSFQEYLFDTIEHYLEKLKLKHWTLDVGFDHTKQNIHQNDVTSCGFWVVEFIYRLTVSAKRIHK